MKKILVLIFGIFLFNIVPVSALNDANTNVLLPVNSSSNAVAGSFSYNGIYYNSALDSNGRATISVGTITNLSDKKIPISFSIGLFDKDKKNIGIVNYCSTQDMGSDYSYKELRKNESSSFSLKISAENYIADKKKIEDVAYYAIFDDNKYCKVGGKNNYVDLTIEQIVGGEVSNKVEKFLDLEFLRDLEVPDFIKNHRNFWMFVGIVFLIYLIQGDILNSLNRKLYNKNSGLAFLPIGNFYVAVKLSFGPIVAKVYFVLLIISVFLKSPMLMFLVSFLSIISYFVVIVKLITKKYNMFYVDKINFNIVNPNSKITSIISNIKASRKTAKAESNKNELFELMNPDKNKAVPKKETKSFFNLPIGNKNNDIEEEKEEENKTIEDNNENNNSSSNNNSNNDEGSSLRDLFK